MQHEFHSWLGASLLGARIYVAHGHIGIYRSNRHFQNGLSHFWRRRNDLMFGWEYLTQTSQDTWQSKQYVNIKIFCCPKPDVCTHKSQILVSKCMMHSTITSCCWQFGIPPSFRRLADSFLAGCSTFIQITFGLAPVFPKLSRIEKGLDVTTTKIWMP